MPNFVVITIANAALIKHASNPFFSMKISCPNAPADLRERLGGNRETRLWARKDQNKIARRTHLLPTVRKKRRRDILCNDGLGT